MKKWHKKHISTKWGIAILGFLLLSVALLIPVLEQNQNILSNAMFKKKTRVVKPIRFACGPLELGKPTKTIDGWCAANYGTCDPAGNINNCLYRQCISACKTCPSHQYPCPVVNIPTCRSVGGTCRHRLSCSPVYLSLSAGDEDCNRFGNFSCCGPRIVTCSSLEGECVNSNSTYRSCTKYGGRINPAGTCPGTKKCCVGAF